MSEVDEMQTKLLQCCKRLRLSAALAERAMVQDGATNQEYLYSLLQSEIQNREEARVMRNLNAAGFPHRYDRRDYRSDEVVFPDGISFDSLMDLDFYQTGKNVIMYGATGTGKTMLSILIGMQACMQNIPVRFFRTAGLVNQLAESSRKDELSTFKRKKLAPAKIIILDEFGYVPYDRIGSQLLFDYLSEVHEQKCIILNTNLEFSQWVNILYDEKMTTALIGRLTHHVELILFPGGNNRLRESSINEQMVRASQRREA